MIEKCGILQRIDGGAGEGERMRITVDLGSSGTRLTPSGPELLLLDG
jgi:hypothetical protein